MTAEVDSITGKIILDANLHIQGGEGVIYDNYYKNGISCIADRIHPQDVERFNKAISCMDDNPSNLITLRMMVDDEYIWVLMAFAKGNSNNEMMSVYCWEVRIGDSDSSDDCAYTAVDEDPGTGILNKRAITEYAKRIISSHPEYNVTIAIIDIDDFKMINDTFGHQFGDEVLLCAARVIKNAVGTSGVAGRIGGDEMFIVLENMQEQQQIRDILKNIRMNIESLYKDREDVSTTCSIGCATYPADAKNFTELFGLADRLLYVAKEKGKNRYIIYEPEYHEKYIKGDSRAFIRSMDKLKLNRLHTVNELLEGFYHDRGISLQEMAEQIGLCFELEDISLYMAPDWKRTPLWGIFKEHDMPAEYITDSQYISSYNDDNLFVINSLPSIQNVCESLYNALREQTISAAIHYRIGSAEDAKAIFTFSKSKVAKKWSRSDVDWICILANMMKCKLLDN